MVRSPTFVLGILELIIPKVVGIYTSVLRPDDLPRRRNEAGPSESRGQEGWRDAGCGTPRIQHLWWNSLLIYIYRLPWHTF